MILSEVRALLAADGQLASLLNAAATDAKIYPNFAPRGAKMPYLLYRSLGAAGTAGSAYAQTAVLEAVCADYGLCGRIMKRVGALLSPAQESSFPRGEKRIFCAVLSGGADFADERGAHVRTAVYKFKFV